MMRSSNKIIQVVLLGDIGTGKTTLVLRFVKVQVSMTAGQERHHSLAPMHYRGAAAALVVYDITSMGTCAKKWVEELKRQENPRVVMALVANKSDLESNREVETEEALQFSEENWMLLIETSAKNAKTALNVNEIFYEIAKRLANSSSSRTPTGFCKLNHIREHFTARLRDCKLNYSFEHNVKYV